MALAAAKDLLSRLPSKDLKRNLEFIIHLQPDIADDLLDAVEQPLVVKKNSQGKEFLCSEYNRDADSYRCPFTNAYVPAFDEGTLPPAPLRALEDVLNTTFAAYADAYYSPGPHVSSVYIWETDAAFAVAVQIRKQLSDAVWESQHVIDVSPVAKGAGFLYRATSTITVWVESTETSRFNIAATVTRSKQRVREPPAHATHAATSAAPGGALAAAHVEPIGDMVQEMEGMVHDQLAQLYFGKPIEVVNEVRSRHSAGVRAGLGDVAAELAGKLKKRADGA